MKKTNGWYLIPALIVLIFFLAGQGVPVHSAAMAYPAAAVIVFLLAFLLVRARAGGILAEGFDRLCRLPRIQFNAGVFLLSGLIYGLMAGVFFSGIPRIDDGLASLFQARLFARGAITLPLPADADFMQIFGVLGAREGLGHWCGMYPPGWPLLLTPGVWLGVPWLVNPLLGALLVVSIAELGRDLYGDRVGRIAALLAIPSPFLLVLSGLHISNIPTALFLCLTLISLRRLRASGRWIWGGSAGLAWGVALLCRPLDAAVLGLIFTVSFLFPLRGLSRCRLGIAAGLLLALLAVGVMLGFQEINTGDWRTPGHEIGMGIKGRFGFIYLWPGRSHTPARGLEHTFLRLRAVNDNLLGWALPSLLIVMLPFLLRRSGRREWTLLLPLPALLFTFACYWYYEGCFPARYITAAVPYLFILAASGLVVLQGAVRARGPISRLPAFLAVSGILFLLVSTPHHLRQYGRRYYDVEEVLPRVVRDYGITNAVVFMDSVGVAKDLDDATNDYYATGFMRNDLDLEGDVLYVRNLAERNIEEVRRRPGRTAYLYRYHRGQDQACLYRMTPEGDDLILDPVEPKTEDLFFAPLPDQD